MTTHDQTIEDQTTEEERYFAVPDQIGDLAESARRHLAYLALAEQIATSENALQQLMDIIERRRANAGQAVPEEKTHEHDGRD